MHQLHSGQGVSATVSQEHTTQLLAQYTGFISGPHLTIQQQLIHKTVRQWQRRQLGPVCGSHARRPAQHSVIVGTN